MLETNLKFKGRVGIIEFDHDPDLPFELVANSLYKKKSQVRSAGIEVHVKNVPPKAFESRLESVDFLLRYANHMNFRIPEGYLEWPASRWDLLRIRFDELRRRRVGLAFSSMDPGAPKELPRLDRIQNEDPLSNDGKRQRQTEF